LHIFYFIRLRNKDPLIYGDDAEYKLLVKPKSPSGKPVGTGTVSGSFTDAVTGEPLNNGLIKTDAGIAALPDRGYYLTLHPSGVFSLTATSGGYLPYTTSFELSAGQAGGRPSGRLTNNHFCSGGSVFVPGVLSVLYPPYDAGCQAGPPLSSFVQAYTSATCRGRPA